MTVDWEAVETVLMFHGPNGSKRVDEMTREELLAEVAQLVEDRDRLKKQVMGDFTYMRDSLGEDHRPGVADLFGPEAFD